MDNGACEAKIEETLYKRYQLRWMEEHDHTLGELIDSIAEYGAEDEPVSWDGLREAFDDWEFDAGFHGEVWPCRREFHDIEFQSEPLMRSLCIDEEEYRAYLDVIGKDEREL